MWCIRDDEVHVHPLDHVPERSGINNWKGGHTVDEGRVDHVVGQACEDALEGRLQTDQFQRRGVRPVPSTGSSFLVTTLMSRSP
jgi:hypothetical protein